MNDLIALVQDTFQNKEISKTEAYLEVVKNIAELEMKTKESEICQGVGSTYLSLIVLSQKLEMNFTEIMLSLLLEGVSFEKELTAINVIHDLAVNTINQEESVRESIQRIVLFLRNIEASYGFETNHCLKVVCEKL